MTNSLSIKKVAAVAVGLAVVFSVAFVSTAKAATSEELQAQISNLLALIAGLQAQLAGGTTGGTTGGSCTAMQFTLSHKLGQSGGDVMNIQKFLNMDAATAVAVSGVGSAGQETAYFGGLSKAAVIKFQNKYASEVLAPVGLSAGTGYWGSSSRAKANALEIARCAGSGTGPVVVVPVGGALTVSAAAQPGNSLAPQSAANLAFTKFTLTAGAAAMTFDSVTVELTGLASKSAFSSVALLDDMGNQVGLTKTLNSNDQATVGETTTIPAGMSKTFTVVGNMNATLTNYAGQVAAFSVVAVNSSATVAGSLPITGAQHTVNASLTLGVATAARGIEDPNSSASKEIGTTGYKAQAVRITAGSAEEIRVKSVRWNQSGSASAGDLANVMLTFDGNTYTPAVSGDYYTFNFGSGVVIAKGLVKEMVLSYDIVNGSASTVIFDIRKSTDLIVSGETYGYGITPTATAGSASTSTSEFTSSTPWFDGATVTITGGSFNSVSKSNSAPAANIAEQKADEILGAFTVDLKGEAITVGTLVMDITVDAGATARSVTNVTLVDQNGTVIAGPVDSTTTWGTSATTVAGALTFSSIDFPTGVTTVYVKGQLDSDWANNDTIAISFQPSTDWSDVTGNSTGDSITLPSATATANTMTIKAAALTATTLTQPVARSVVGGATDFIWAMASLDAADSGEDIKVTTIILEDTVATAGNATDIDNVEIWADLNGVAGDSVRGDAYETRVSDAEQWAGTSTGNHDLSVGLETHITVAKNGSVGIAVVGDLASSPTTGGTHSVSVREDGSDVTAVGLTSGTSVAVTGSGTGQAMTPATSGALTITVDSSSPVASRILDDTSAEQTVGIFRLAATNVEDIDIDSITITDGGSDDNVSMYKFYVGSTLVGSKVGGATAQVFFADGTVIAPADGYVLVTVKAVMNNIDGTGVVNGNTVQATIAAAGDVDVTGRDSGVSAITPTLTTGDAAVFTNYEAIPTVLVDNAGVSTTLVNNTNHLLAKLVITNTGSEDVTLNGTDTNVISAQFNVVAATTTGTYGLTLKDENGNVLDSDEVYARTAAVQQIDFDLDGAYSAGLVIPAGTSEIVYLYGDTSGLSADGDTVQVWFDDAAADFTYGIDSTGDLQEGDEVFKGDMFGPAHVNPS